MLVKLLVSGNKTKLWKVKEVLWKSWIFLQVITSWILLVQCQASNGFRFRAPDFNTKLIPRTVDFEDIEGGFEFNNVSENKIVNRSEKRFNKHLKHPCGCHVKEKLKDFGVNSFPPSRMEKLCDREKNSNSENHCNFGSECKEHYVTVKLLKKKTQNSDNDDEVDYDLPPSLRKNYFWDSQLLSIDCRCSFK